MNETDSLKALSPIDGRYNKQTKDLGDFFSEAALIKYRIRVECLYFIELLDFLHKEIPQEKKQLIESLWLDLSDNDLSVVKEIEKVTNHDVKAVEYFIKEFLTKNQMESVKEWVHFALTSEDTNNLAYALMLKDSLEKSVLPAIKNINLKLADLTDKNSNIAMLAKTHGQPATPTTLGKEIAVFLNRSLEQTETLVNLKIKGKLNSATGGFNAFYSAFPEQDWFSFSKNFIEKLGLEFNEITTQIEPHDRFAEIFDCISRLNNVLIDINIDIWQYISQGYFVLEKKENEVGSSTMPHKVNPIDFENSEGNLGLANSILHFMKDKLTKSRLQRDLSDSTVLRNIGSTLGYCLIGYKSNLRGLNKIAANKEKIVKDLNENVEVLAEAIQTILRAEGIENPYELLKSLTRGNKLSLDEIHLWINNLDVDNSVKEKLLKLKPETYTGISEQLAKNIVNKAQIFYKI